MPESSATLPASGECDRLFINEQRDGTLPFLTNEKGLVKTMKLRIFIGVVVLISAALVAQASTPSGLVPAKNSAREAAQSESQSENDKNKTAPARRAFQARVIVTPTGDGFQTQFLPIPAGKRLVIENVSAVGRSPEGMRMEINFFTHIDNNGDGVGDVSDIVFHRIALTEQGTFGGIAISAANHQILAFADEQIGQAHFQVGVSARLNGVPPANTFAQAQLTFTGYVEDLPVAL
jgi:hypothetical protein